MTDDIVKRLRGPRTEQGGLWPIPNLHEEAADEIEKLRAENVNLFARLDKAHSFISRADWMQFFKEEQEADAALGESDD